MTNRRRMTETYNSNLHEEKRKRNSSSVSIESSTSSSPARSKSKTIENVLILQGGGSLGAFGCGVFKALAKENSIKMSPFLCTHIALILNKQHVNIT